MAAIGITVNFVDAPHTYYQSEKFSVPNNNLESISQDTMLLLGTKKLSSVMQFSITNRGAFRCQTAYISDVIDEINMGLKK